MRRLLLTLPLLFASCAHHWSSELPATHPKADHHWSSELPATHPEADRLHQYLRSIVIPQVDLVDASIEDAIELFRYASRKYSPDNRGAGVILRGAGLDKTVTVRSVAMGPLDLLDEICRQGDLVWRIEPYAIVVKARVEPITGANSSQP